MSLRYLLDTMLLSEPLRPAPNPRVVERLSATEGEIATASVVWHELWYGCERLTRSRRRDVIEKYLIEEVWPRIPVLPYDGEAARWHAAERARLAGVGKTAAFADGQIAAIAKVNGLVVVTANVGHYQGFRGIDVESWS